MVLHIDSGVVYLVLPRACSRLVSHFFLGPDPSKTNIITSNGPLLTECKTIWHVVSSAAETETTALFHNAQTAHPIRYILAQLGHPQPPTPLKTDNTLIHETMMHKNPNHGICGTGG